MGKESLLRQVTINLAGDTGGNRAANRASAVDYDDELLVPDVVE